MSVYLLNGDQVPAPVLPTGFIDPTDGPPAALPALINGSTPLDAVPTWHQWARSIEAMGREGAGGRFVARGLALSDSGKPLTAAVAPGLAMIDVPVPLPDGGELVVSDNTYNAGDITKRTHVWLLQSGILSGVNHDLTPPSDACAYLGSCRTQGGAFVDFDASGVFYRLQGGPLLRRTADPAEPADTPPALIAFRARTQGGYYEWTGEEWVSASLDSKTVLLSPDHDAAGTLAELLTVGEDAGLSLGIEEVDGVPRLVLRSVLGDVDLSGYLSLDGGKAMLGKLNFGGKQGINLASGLLPTDAANVGQVATAKSEAISAAAAATTDLFKRDGSRKASAPWDMDGNRIKNVPTEPVALSDAVNGQFVVDTVANHYYPDRYVKVTEADTTPGVLYDKILAGRGLSRTINLGPGDQTLTYALTPHEEILPSFDVVCPPGEERIISVRFGALEVGQTDRGSFLPDFPYEVIPDIQYHSAGTGHYERYVVEEIQSQHELLYYTGSTFDPYSKTGKVFYLRLCNYSPDRWTETPPQTSTFTINVRLRGLGWVPGANPTAAPDVEVYSYSSWHTETFTLPAITVPKGGSVKAEVTFLGLGRYQGPYSIKAEPANTDAQCLLYTSGQTDHSFQLQVENARLAASTSVTLTVTLHGRRWWPVGDYGNWETPADPAIEVISATSPVARTRKEFGLNPTVNGTGAVLQYPMSQTTWIGGAASSTSQGRCFLTDNDEDSFVTLTKHAAGGGTTAIGTATFTAGSATATFSFPDGEIELSAGDWIEAAVTGDTDAAGWIAIALVGEVAA